MTVRSRAAGDDRACVHAIKNETQFRATVGIVKIPITVIATTRPSPTSLPHPRRTGTALVARRDAITRIAPTGMLLAGRATVSEPDTSFRIPGCACCAIREDLVASIIRAVRRREPPEHIVVVVDPTTDDPLTAIATLLSSPEISRRCTLDSVVVHLDAVEVATRLATGDRVLDVELEPAVAVADLLVIDGLGRITESARRSVSAALHDRAGFARLVLDPSDRDRRLNAWHGAPTATTIAPHRDDAPSTVVLRLESPLDPDAVDEWLDLLVARHATRLLRMQGALSVAGSEDRVCCLGVRSFAVSHSEHEHAVTHRSTESVLALCGVGLDAEELSASFGSTAAS